jgi:hypothetical protein
MKNFFVFGGVFQPPTISSGVSVFLLQRDEVGDGSWATINSISVVQETIDHAVQFAFLLETPAVLADIYIPGTEKWRVVPEGNTRGTFTAFAFGSKLFNHMISLFKRANSKAIALYDTHFWSTEDLSSVSSTIFDSIFDDPDKAVVSASISGMGTLTLDSY